MQNKNLKTLSQLSIIYDISMSRLYKATHSNEFAFYKPFGGKVYVDEKVFIKWLTQNRVPSANEVRSQSAIPA